MHIDSPNSVKNDPQGLYFIFDYLHGHPLADDVHVLVFVVTPQLPQVSLQALGVLQALHVPPTKQLQGVVAAAVVVVVDVVVLLAVDEQGGAAVPEVGQVAGLVAEQVTPVVQKTSQ